MPITYIDKPNITYIEPSIGEGFDKLGNKILNAGKTALGYGEALLEMPLKVPLSLGAGLGGAGYGLATEGTKEGLLKGMERGVETVKPITDLSFFEKTRPAEEHLGELWDEWITQPTGRLNAEEFRLAIKKLEKQKKPIPNWLLEAESSARAQGETLGNAGAFLLGFKRKGKKGPTSEQISKEASDIIAKEQPKITYIDPYAEYAAKTVAEQKAEILAKEQARLQPDINSLEKEYGRTDWAPDLTTTGESRLPPGPETPAVMRVRPDRNVADQAEIGKPASLEALGSPKGTIPYPGPGLQPKRPLEAPRASEEGIAYPDRMTEVDSLKIRETLDKYQRWVEDARKSGDLELEQTLRQEFKDLMDKLNVQEHMKTRMEAPYTSTRGGMEPLPFERPQRGMEGATEIRPREPIISDIVKTENPDLSAPKPWSETTPSAFGLADLDKPTIGGKFAKLLTKTEKTPAQIEKVGQFRKPGCYIDPDIFKGVAKLFEKGLTKFQVLDKFIGTFDAKEIELLKNNIQKPDQKTTVRFMSPEEFHSFALDRLITKDPLTLKRRENRHQRIREGL